MRLQDLMAAIREFDFPEELHYLVDKHVWVRLLDDGLARIGLTPVAYHQLRHSLVAISLRPSVLGVAVPKGRSVAMVESLKYIGPLSAPFDGVVVRGNDALVADPEQAEADPYGAGWIIEMLPADWPAARLELLTGEAAMRAYEALLVAQGIDAS